MSAKELPFIISKKLQKNSIVLSDDFDDISCGGFIYLDRIIHKLPTFLDELPSLAIKHYDKIKQEWISNTLVARGTTVRGGEEYKYIPKEKFMCNKPWWQRLLILCAGVTMNFILAFVLLFITSLIWGSASFDTVIDSVEVDSPAYKAGIRDKDMILSVNNHNVNSWDTAQIELIMKDDDNKFKEISALVNENMDEPFINYSRFD